MSHTKKYIFLFLILGIGIFFYSCQHDDIVYIEEIESFEQKRTKKVVSLNEVIGLETIIRKVETVRNEGNSTAHLHSENTNYLGTLNLDHIVSITDGYGNESYTIDIENEESGINFEKLRLI
ncbi:hypothetical protein IMCC3317_22830 [Kordia antarctica]|uniref:Uncharacterized protein n=1 Tax=Kordia antarctica TaxID=1218801 RepID=A0A7L4ZJM5_9FLAO|nr:hypothetical protein [Kordia antarctica]QHI36913.1 hypothetical protein IMCC3317_22830 [Kordia antarctica]